MENNGDKTPLDNSSATNQSELKDNASITDQSERDAYAHSNEHSQNQTIDPPLSKNDSDPTLNNSNEKSQSHDEDDDLNNPFYKRIQKPESNTNTKQQDSIKKQSFSRFFNDPKIRVGVFFGSLLFIGVSAYAVFGGSDEVTSTTDDQNSKVTMPNTKIKGSATLTQEQQEHLRKTQEEEALKALNNGSAYMPALNRTAPSESASEPLILDDAPTPVLFGSGSQPDISNNLNTENQKLYFDKATNRQYTVAEANQLLQQNKRIEGVTHGKGSITDTSSPTSEKNPQPIATQPSTPSYEVKPLGSSTQKNQTEYSVNQKQNLDKSKAEADQWANDYMNLRLKKAQAVDAKAQASFELDLQKLENALAKKTPQFAQSHYSVSSVQKTRTVNQATNQALAQQEIKNAQPPIVYAGETALAYLNSEVNTDNGTEVIATIRSGALKGSIIIGTVRQTNNNIQFVFNRVLRKKGLPELAVNAVARQIDTNSLGMADDIQKHYLQRYSALVLASGLSGVGEAYEQTSGVNASVGNGVVVSEASEPSNKRILGNAVGELGNQLSSDISQNARRKPTYITNSGKVFNIFFNQNVTENQSSK